MTQKIKLVDKDNISAIVNMFCMFKKIKENMNMLKRNMEEIKKTQIEFLEIKQIKVWDEKYTR